MTAAVTPVPQVLMIGLDGSTPFDLKTASSSEAGRRVLLFGSRRSVIGTEMEYGMCPDDKPAKISYAILAACGSSRSVPSLGSGSTPFQRAKLRASRI